MKRIAYVVMALCLAGSTAFAAERGTADEAKSLVGKAVAFIKANGAEKAYSTINAKDPQFIDRDLYIFVQTTKGVTLAHATNAKLIGQDMAEAADTDGKLYVKERLDAAKTQKAFWTDYKYGNPTTKKIEPKSTYCEVVDATMVCCGIYK